MVRSVKFEPLAGKPGFLSSPDPRLLRIGGLPLPGDPLADNLRPGAPLGLLGIQPATRRRNRMNGRIAELDAAGIAVAVDQSFGNCAKYIQARAPRFIATGGTATPKRTEETALLSAPAQALIERADTFFIGTASAKLDSDDRAEGVDVNHRGGRPGFVRVEAEDGRTVLTAPDFPGNNAFATFGNIAVNPRAGMLFVDFDTGAILMLTGEAAIRWRAPDGADFPEAERFLRFFVSEGAHVHESGQRGSVMTGRAFAAFLRAVPRDGSQDRRLTVAAF